MPSITGHQKAQNFNPKVNPPRPTYVPQAGVANPTVAKSPATTPSQPTNAPAAPAPSTQTEPMDPFKAQATNTSTNMFALPSYTPQNGQPDPRDSSYWANVSKLMFNATQDYAKANYEQSTADTTYNASVRDALQARGTQQRTLGEDAIRGNLGSSGWLNRSEGEQTRDYTEQRADALGQKSSEDQQRAAVRKAILQGYGIDTNNELAFAGDRYAQGALNSAQTGAPQVGAPAPYGAPAPPSPFAVNSPLVASPAKFAINTTIAAKPKQKPKPKGK